MDTEFQLHEEPIADNNIMELGGRKARHYSVLLFRLYESMAQESIAGVYKRWRPMPP